jgi:hypothetical protein
VAARRGRRGSWVPDLVGLLRDGAGDAATAQVGAVRTRAVGVVGPDLVRAGARSTSTEPGHADAAKHHLELRGIAALTGGDDQCEGLVSVFDGQMKPGGQATARATEAVVGGLDVEPAGFVPL